jgi:hypothetical protein
MDMSGLSNDPDSMECSECERVSSVRLPLCMSNGNGDDSVREERNIGMSVGRDGSCTGKTRW